MKVEVNFRGWSDLTILPRACGKIYPPWVKRMVEARKVPFERISIDPAICDGQACVKGTRIPVHQVVRMLANGDTIEGLLAEYPSLTRADVLACLDYAAELAEE